MNTGGRGRWLGLLGWTLLLLAIPRLLEQGVTRQWLILWYGRTGHEGLPPAEAVFAAVSWGKPLGYALTIAGLLLFWHKTRPRELLGLPLRGAWRDAALGIPAGLAWALLMWLKGVNDFRGMFVPDWDTMRAIPLILGTGAGQEILFRGFLFFLLTRAKAGSKTTVAWTAAAFAAGQAWYDWDAVFWGAGFGLTLGLMRAWRGNAWSAVAAHLVFEACLQPDLMLQKLEAGLGEMQET